MSASVRWAGWTVLAVLIGLAAARLFEDHSPLEQRVLARVPAGSAIVGYAELDPLRRSAVLGRLVRERLVDSAGLAMVEPDVEAIAVAVGSDEIVGLAAGRFPFALVRRYLEQQGATCPGALDEQACSLPTPDGFLSIRALEAGLVGVTNGPRADSANRLADNAAGEARLPAVAREALDSGTLVWISIDPRRLAETMSDPPEGWINLSLVARALLSAEEAALYLEDDEAHLAVRATLRAVSASEADAVELAKMLESLNGLLVSALRMGKSADNHAWADALAEGFLPKAQKNETTASWQLPVALLEQALQAQDSQ